MAAEEEGFFFLPAARWVEGDVVAAAVVVVAAVDGVDSFAFAASGFLLTRFFGAVSVGAVEEEADASSVTSAGASVEAHRPRNEELVIAEGALRASEEAEAAALPAVGAVEEKEIDAAVAKAGAPPPQPLTMPPPLLLPPPLRRRRAAEAAEESSRRIVKQEKGGRERERERKRFYEAKEKTNVDLDLSRPQRNGKRKRKRGGRPRWFFPFSLAQEKICWFPVVSKKPSRRKNKYAKEERSQGPVKARQQPARKPLCSPT